MFFLFQYLHNCFTRQICVRIFNLSNVFRHHNVVSWCHIAWWCRAYSLEKLRNLGSHLFCLDFIIFSDQHFIISLHVELHEKKTRKKNHEMLSIVYETYRKCKQNIFEWQVVGCWDTKQYFLQIDQGLIGNRQNKESQFYTPMYSSYSIRLFTIPDSLDVHSSVSFFFFTQKYISNTSETDSKWAHVHHSYSFFIFISSFQFWISKCFWMRGTILRKNVTKLWIL